MRCLMACCLTAVAMATVPHGTRAQEARDPDKVIADTTEAIRKNPEDPTVHVSRGRAWATKDELDRAIADYDEAIRIDPEYADPRSNRAWLRATCPDGQLRDGRRAVDDATRACELSA